VALCWVGLAASVLIVFNLWPRMALAICFVCFLSFVSVAQDFSGYQSDGMLLEAGFIALFFAPAGMWPGLGRCSPSRASLFLLQWEWFRIYFESGVAKIASGEPQWRNFTAMDQYYQNGPLPTWIGWYAQHLPHWFHAAATAGTLVLELGLVWMLFLPRPWRIACFFIATAWQIPVILTANYTFLNYLVLVLGFLLLDDRFIVRTLPGKWRKRVETGIENAKASAARTQESRERELAEVQSLRKRWTALRVAVAAVMLTWILYVTTVEMLWMIWPRINWPRATRAPVVALYPFRIANQYGLFAVMTRGRWEIEFQGSDDGQNWVAYPFRYKPQDPRQAPGIYAPYQPRFDWNLWFASFGNWRENAIVPSAEEALLVNDPDVLALFAGNPFPQHPPKQVRAVLWQYWFTSLEEKRTQGLWWRRQLLGLYAPTLTRTADGRFGVVEWPVPASPRQ
ncbi:MAG TPA: lipase maturation factor family protein, partial [Terriglobales bacterium]|nr:lipase maturation factor family protein [Terriglobales bacterium]